MLASASFTENQQIWLYQEMQVKIGFWYITFTSFHFFESLKIVSINMGTVLMMSAKMDALGLYKVALK